MSILVLACQEEQTERRRMLKKRRGQRGKKEAFKSFATVEVESSTSNSNREGSSEDKFFLEKFFFGKNRMEELKLAGKSRRKGQAQTEKKKGCSFQA